MLKTLKIMPNWAFVHYKVVGDKKEIATLDEILTNMRDGVYKDDGMVSLIKNDFGPMWLGNLVHVLGGNWEEIYCRGEITDFQLSEDDSSLSVCMETAWSEPNEVRAFIQQKFPNLNILFSVEEPGMGVYATNDTEFYENFRYYLDVCIDSRDCDMESEYFPTLEAVVAYIKEHLPVEPSVVLEPTKESINAFIDNWTEVNEVDFMSLNEFSLVD